MFLYFCAGPYIRTKCCQFLYFGDIYKNVYSSVDSSELSILPPRVRFPSTPSALLSLIVKFLLYLSLHFEKDENKQKRDRVRPLKSTELYLRHFNCSFWVFFFLLCLWLLAKRFYPKNDGIVRRWKSLLKWSHL